MSDCIFQINPGTELLPKTKYPKDFNQLNVDELTTDECLQIVLNFFKLNEDKFNAFISPNGVRFSGMLYITYPMLVVMFKTNINNNRRLAKDWIDYFKNEVEQNNWCDTNGTQLMFLTAGNLADGQTRTKGLIESKVAGIWVRVGYNHTMKDIETIDCNRKRNIIENAIISGVYEKKTKRTDQAAKQMVKYLHCYDSKLPANRYCYSDINVKFTTQVFNDYCIKYNDENNLLFPCYTYALSFPNIKRSVASLLATCYLISIRKYGNEIKQLFDDIHNIDMQNTRDMRAQLRSLLETLPITGNHSKIEYWIFKIVYNYVHGLPMVGNLMKHGDNSDPKEIMNYRPDYI